MVLSAKDWGAAWSEWMTTPEAQAYSNIRDLAERRVRGNGPPYVKLSGRNGKVLYSRQSIDEWLKSRMVKSTSEHSALQSTAAG